MKKLFLSNIFLILALNLIAKPLYVFGIDVQVQNIVGPESYGIYFALFNFCYLFQILLDPGLQNLNTQSLSGDKTLFQKQFPQILFTKTILAIGFFLLILLFAFLIGYPKEYYYYIILIIVLQVLISFLLFLRSNISSLGMFRKDVYLSALDKVLLVVGLGYIIWFSPFKDALTIAHFIQAQILSVLFTILIAASILYQKTARLDFRFSFSGTKGLLKKALPFGLVFLLMTLYTRMDGVMLERLLDDGGLEAGIYAAAFKMYDAANMIGFLFATLLLPMFSSMGKKRFELSELTTQALQILMAIVIPLVCLVFLYADDIMPFLFHDATSYYAAVMRVLILAFFCVALSYIFGTLVTSTGQLRKMNMLFLLGIGLNWILNLMLIPEYKALGAAYTTLATQAFVIVGQIILAFQLTKINIPVHILLKIVFVLCLTAFFSYYLMHSMTVHWLVKLVVSGIISLGLSFLVGLLRLEIAKESIELDS